jgi:hypothetical protein
MIFNKYLNLKNNQKRTILLPVLLKGQQSFRGIDQDLKSFIAGLGHFNINTSSKINIPFQETDYNAQIRVLIKKENQNFSIEKINLFSTYNNLIPIDVTKEFKQIQNINNRIIQEWIINNYES